MDLASKLFAPPDKGHACMVNLTPEMVFARIIEKLGESGKIAKNGVKSVKQIMPTVLWWGRGDKNYSRNRTIARLFGELGWDCDYFFPAIGSELGLVQAWFSRLKKPDLIWVPCFRQRDMASAIRFSQKWGVPLVSDPLTSSYQKQVYERNKFTPESWRAQRLLRWVIGLV